MKERLRLDVFIACIDRQLRHFRLERRRIERPFQRQIDIRRGFVQFHKDAGGRILADRQRALFHASNELHDAAVLEPCLIVEIAPQLFREARDGPLGYLAGLEPIVMDAAQSPFRRKLAHGG